MIIYNIYIYNYISSCWEFLYTLQLFRWPSILIHCPRRCFRHFMYKFQAIKLGRHFVNVKAASQGFMTSTEYFQHASTVLTRHLQTANLNYVHITSVGNDNSITPFPFQPPQPPTPPHPPIKIK